MFSKLKELCPRKSDNHNFRGKMINPLYRFRNFDSSHPFRLEKLKIRAFESKVCSTSKFIDLQNIDSNTHGEHSRETYIS